MGLVGCVQLGRHLRRKDPTLNLIVMNASQGQGLFKDYVLTVRLAHFHQPVTFAKIVTREHFRLKLEPVIIRSVSTVAQVHGPWKELLSVLNVKLVLGHL